MIDQAAELCAEWIYLAGLASWRALPVFLVVASLSLLLRRHVPARAVCLLWLLVIARFLMPVSVGSQVAMSNWIDRSVVALTSDSSATDANKDEFDTFTFVLDDGESVTMALLPPEATTEEQAAANAKAQRLAEVESNRRPAAVVPQRGMTGEFPGEPGATSDRVRLVRFAGLARVDGPLTVAWIRVPHSFRVAT